MNLIGYNLDGVPDLVAPSTPVVPSPPRRSARWWGLVLGAASIPLAGELFGHPYFSRIGDSLAHHAFHLVTVVIAGGLFWVLAAEDIRRNGVPPRLLAMQRGYRWLRGVSRARP